MPQGMLCCVQVRTRPTEDPEALLATYLQQPESQRLNDDELIMDMFQMLVFGTYGLLTQVKQLIR